MEGKIQKNILTFFSIALLAILVIWALLSVNGRTVNPNDPQQPITNKGAIRILNKELENLKYQLFIDEQETDLIENSIRNLNPGSYNIKIIVEKYNTWESNVSVLPGMITEITPYLFAQNSNYALKTSTPINISNIFFSKYTDYAYFVVSNTNLGSEKGIWKIYLDDSSTIFSTNNTSAVKILNLDPQISKNITDNNFELISSPDESKMLFRGIDSNYIFSTDSLISQNNKELVDIKEIIGFSPEEIYWFKQGNSLIIYDKNLLAELDLSTEQLKVINYSPESKPVYSVNGDIVYYIDNETGKIMVYKEGKKNILALENQVIPDTINGIWVGNSNANYLILQSVNKFYFVDIEKSFLDLIGEEINIIQISSNGKSIIFEKDSNIYTYYLDEINPINDYQAKKALILSNYNSQNMSVKFNNKSSHVLIRNTKENGEESIEVLEKNSQNRYELYKGTNLVGDYFQMIKNNKELILVLETDTVSNNSNSQNLQKNNLYSRDLEV
jgi:hypothetical protein